MIFLNSFSREPASSEKNEVNAFLLKDDLFNYLFTDEVLVKESEERGFGLTHCEELDTSQMVARKELKKEAEASLKTEVDDTTGEILVELDGHKYPIDSEFSYCNGEKTSLSSHTGIRDSVATTSYPDIKTEPIDNYKEENEYVKIQTPRFRTTVAKNCSVKSEHRNRNHYDELNKHTNINSEQGRTGSYESPELLENDFHQEDMKINCFPFSHFNGQPIRYEIKKSWTESHYAVFPNCHDFTPNYPSTDQQQSEAYQDFTSQYTPSACSNISSGFSNVTCCLPEKTHDVRYRPEGWSFDQPGFSIAPQFDHQRSGHRPPVRKIKRGCRLWEFIRNLLLDPASNPSLIRWENRDEGMFKLVQSKAIAYMWGMKKGNRGMTYEKLSRAMRYYYKRQVFAPVLGKRLVYKFGPRAVGWKE